MEPPALIDEEKWGVLERFRVRTAWADRVASERPGLLASHIARRTEMMAAGAHALGPFELPADDGAWLMILWQFPSREAAADLLAMCREPEWEECVEHHLLEGHKHDPRYPLPGFA